MKTIFENSTRDELLARIQSLHENNHSRWGKMNAYQMLKHCAQWDDMMFGRMLVKRIFLGKIFGRLALGSVLKNDNPLRKNSPTVPELVINEKSGDFVLQQTEWLKRIREYEHYNNPHFIHPFFGAMTRDQVGKFVYKHHDHHLRQFGV